MSIQGSQSIKNFREGLTDVGMMFAAMTVVFVIAAVAFRNLKLSSHGDYARFVKESSQYSNWNSSYQYGYVRSWADVTYTNVCSQIFSRFALFTAGLSASTCAANFMSYHPTIERQFAVGQVA